MSARRVLSNHSGFSLVELAISVTAVGVLLSLVVIGARMMVNAKVAGTASQVREISIAIDEFRQQYRAWPGDFSRARSVLNNCTAAFLCSNGNGNGAIGGGSPDWGDELLSDAETLGAWRHLSLSEIAPRAAARLETGWGRSHPVIDMNGGLEIFFDGNHALNGSYGHFLRLSGRLSATDLAASDGIDRRSMQLLDVKIDDGLPLTGKLTAGSVPANSCVNGGNYVAAGAASLNSRDCVGFIQLQKF